MNEQAGVPAREATPPDEPMGLIEAIVLFGGLVVIIDGIGAVVKRLDGLNFLALSCLSLFVSLALYIGAGFVAARHTTFANGVWASIAVVSIDAILGQSLVAVITPSYRELPTELLASVPEGFLAIVIVAAVFGVLISVLLTGLICGAIGAAIAGSAPFRPRYRYITE